MLRIRLSAGPSTPDGPVVGGVVEPSHWLRLRLSMPAQPRGESRRRWRRRRREEQEMGAIKSRFRCLWSARDSPFLSLSLSVSPCALLRVIICAHCLCTLSLRASVWAERERGRECGIHFLGCGAAAAAAAAVYEINSRSMGIVKPAHDRRIIVIGM